MTTLSIDEYFDGKPASLKIFSIVRAQIASMGPSEMTIGSQISFGRARKFAWFWLYNVTKRNPDGVPHLMLALDHPVESDKVRVSTKIGKHRWNHQIIVRDAGDARSPWLADLLRQAYQYGEG